MERVSFRPYRAETRDVELATTRSRIKAGVAGGASGRSLRPAVRVVTGFAVYQKWGQKQTAGITFAVTIPEHLLSQRKNRGHAPERSSL